MFRNVGIYNSDAGELPKRKHNIFRTRRKFEIKNSYDVLWDIKVKVKVKFTLEQAMKAQRAANV